MDGNLETSSKDVLQQYVNLIDGQLDGLATKKTNPIALQNVIENFVGTIDEPYPPKKKFIDAIQSVSPKFISGVGYRNEFNIFFSTIKNDIAQLKPGEPGPTTISPDQLKLLVKEHENYLQQITKAGTTWQEKWEENLRRAQQYARLALENPEYARLAIDGQLAFLRVPKAIRPFFASDVIADIQKALKGKLLDQKLPHAQKRLTVVDIETIAGNSIQRLQQQYNISLGLPKNVSLQLVKSIRQINEAQGVTIGDLAQLPYAAVVKETSWIASVIQFQKEVLFNIKSPTASSDLAHLSEKTAVSLTDSWVQYGSAGFNQPDQLNRYLNDLNTRLQASGIFLTPAQLSGITNEHMPVYRALQLLAASGLPTIYMTQRAGELLTHVESASKELLQAPAVSSEKKPAQRSTAPLLSVPLISGLLRLPQLAFLTQVLSAPLRVLNNFSLSNLLSRARPGFGLAPMLKRSVLFQWWFWLIMVFLFIVFSGIIPGSDDVISDITNAFIYQGKSQIEFGGTHLASGSCPIVKDPKIILGSYQGLTGHGSPLYWGGGAHTYSIPIVGMYSPGCLLPGLCPYYGFATDVNSGSEKLAEVTVPYICPAGGPCSDSEVVWTVQTTFFNCQGGSTATEADCRKQKWGWGSILTATANGHSWQLYLNHIDTQLPIHSTYAAPGSQPVAKLYQGDMSTPHVHIELNMDGAPLRPDFLCDGTGGGGGPMPGPAPLITGDCKAENLTMFQSEAQNASCICSRESGGGNVHATNQGCLVGATREYSVGLFQINLLVHTPAELIQQITNLDPTAPETSNISWINSSGETKTATIPFRGRCTAAFNWPGGTSCSLRNQQIFELCRNHFYDPDNNKNYAQQLQSSSGWGPWSTRTDCGL